MNDMFGIETQPRWGCGGPTVSQGSSFLATLGFDGIPLGFATEKMSRNSRRKYL